MSDTLTITLRRYLDGMTALINNGLHADILLQDPANQAVREALEHHGYFQALESKSSPKSFFVWEHRFDPTALPLSASEQRIAGEIVQTAHECVTHAKACSKLRRQIFRALEVNPANHSTTVLGTMLDEFKRVIARTIHMPPEQRLAAYEEAVACMEHDLREYILPSNLHARLAPTSKMEQFLESLKGTTAGNPPKTKIVAKGSIRNWAIGGTVAAAAVIGGWALLTQHKGGEQSATR